LICNRNATKVRHSSKDERRFLVSTVEKMRDEKAASPRFIGPFLLKLMPYYFKTNFNLLKSTGYVRQQKV
jgi:hypothetical protein